MPRSLFVWTGSISYEGFSFWQVACVYFCYMFYLVILCLISAVVGGGGGGFWPMVGRGVLLSVVSGFLRVASLSEVTLVN